MLQPEKTCFLIADISGYTEYLAGVEIDHAQDILADLISSVVTSLRPTFRLSKLEGDAAFCYAPAEQVDASLLLDTIERCYFGFRRRRRDVRQATSCECNACMRIPDLNLKFVAHSGLALKQKIAGHEELLGSDVITVHRLLKNDIVAKRDVTAYAGLTDRLVQELAIDPAALGMLEHSETYDHIGELRLWVHDLERRWHEEDASRRVIVTAKDAVFAVSAEVLAPPQVVWEFVTKPGRRMQWQAVSGVTGVLEQTGSGGRRGVGTVNHCMHGPDAMIEEILDWRPYDYFTDKATMPGGGPTFDSTYEFEPTAQGTMVHFRIAQPRKKSDRMALEAMAPHLAEGIEVSLSALKGEAQAETTRRTAGSDPPLPSRRAVDGFLDGIEPIQIVG